MNVFSKPAAVGDTMRQIEPKTFGGHLRFDGVTIMNDIRVAKFTFENFSQSWLNRIVRSRQARFAAARSDSLWTSARRASVRGNMLARASAPKSY